MPNVVKRRITFTWIDILLILGFSAFMIFIYWATGIFDWSDLLFAPVSTFIGYYIGKSFGVVGRKD